MSVIFDLTVVANELFDSVIVMDKSPAFSAFREEIEKILSDFNKTGKYWEASSVNVKKLLEESMNTIHNMQKSYLLWTISEERGREDAEESSYEAFVKLFYKSQESQLVFLNDGKKTIAECDVAKLRDKFLKAVSTNSELFNSVKDFFSGYVYGYFFNYLSEQKVMKKYAEFIVCLAIMSGKIKATESEKQQILLKMAKLLNIDRFKYISGFIPLSVMINVVCDRFEMGSISELEMAKVARYVTAYMTKNYETSESDDQQLIADNVTATVMSSIGAEYVNVEKLAEDTFNAELGGERTFLDCDREDFGEYDKNRVINIFYDKCRSNHDAFYISGRDAVIDLSLGSDGKGFRYPLVYKDGENYFCSPIYTELIYPVADDVMFSKVEISDIPFSDFLFIMAELKTNIIRKAGKLSTTGYSIRTDKMPLIEQAKKINSAKKRSDSDKKMNKLEIALSVVSGNMSADEYKDMFVKQVLGTDLYEEYIRFRMDKLFESGMKSLDAKKNLLDELNKIND